jgi:tRNA pseudouridine38-40 synthase
VRRRLAAGEARLARAPLTPEDVALFRITLAYDGTDFLGWQRQGSGRTVQGEVEAALARLAAGARVAVTGAGRTDAGVHALGQVASFELPRATSAPELCRALNGLLPEDVRVLEASPAPAGFHARRSARSKLYRYQLDCGGVRLPQRRRFAAFVAAPLDAEAVTRAAALYLGRHDFAALASAGGSATTTKRTVSRSEVRFDSGGFVYEVEADGFLRKMVRSMVGGLIAAGRGALSVEELAGRLASRERRLWPAPAPACGLTLVRVEYPVLG